MLPGEIEPYANMNIEALTEMLDDLQPLQTHTRPILPMEIEEWYATARNARAALTRFKICMADEVKQKERYAKYAHENGYTFS